ncbi:5-oxoprolinase subunit PxpA [Vibrio ulleungensis]
MRLNCDLGEGFGQWQTQTDALAMPHIDMANIACGFHASDPLTMSQTVQLAKTHSVSIGAHPGYPDLVGFGRRSMAMKHDELVSTVVYQVGALQAIAQIHGVSVDYIKPHGAMYNDMMANSEVFNAAIQACELLSLPLMVLAGQACERYINTGANQSVSLLKEGFCDRRYSNSGALVPRSHSQGVLTDSSDILQQAIEMSKGYVTTVEGDRLALSIDSLCVHGDNSTSVALIAEIRNQIKGE